MSKEAPGILAKLALKYGSDKWGHHYYCNHYERHLQQFKELPITLVELGVGGYEYPDRGGAGLCMWAEFFTHPAAWIFGIDIHEKKLSLPKRATCIQGSQADPDISERTSIYNPSVVIDDASHMNALTIAAFKVWFPKLVPGGVYIIEDIESSWWAEAGFDGCRDNKNLEAPTTINFCRLLLNEVNKKTTGSNLYPIASMHFYENVVIIHKSA